jgi:hypothetical protein
VLGSQDSNSSEAGNTERTGMISTNSFDFYEADTPRGGGGGLGGLARRASAWAANVVGRLLYQVRRSCQDPCQCSLLVLLPTGSCAALVAAPMHPAMMH